MSRSRSLRPGKQSVLITTAVVAERPEALQKLQELFEHPYFRYQVTTLIWDASTYDKNVATSYDVYKERFGYSPHLKKSRIVRSTYTLLPQGNGPMQPPSNGSTSHLLRD
jgi:hypothetical protein